MVGSYDARYDPSSGEAPPPEVIAAMTQASQKTQDPVFKAASGRVQAWFTASCGT
jgi:hypothetical protein